MDINDSSTPQYHSFQVIENVPEPAATNKKSQHQYESYTHHTSIHPNQAFKPNIINQSIPPLKPIIQNKIKPITNRDNLTFITFIKVSTFLIVIILLLSIAISIAQITNTVHKHNENNNGNAESNSCDDSKSIDFNLNFDNKKDPNSNELKIDYLPNEILLPGSQFFSYSYNLLQGKPPMDLLLSGDYHQIIQLPFDQDRVSSGSKAYLVPDQIDLPAITGVCESQKETSSSIMYSELNHKNILLQIK